MSDKPRVLMVTGECSGPGPSLSDVESGLDVVPAKTLPEALSHLGEESFAGVYFPIGNADQQQQAWLLMQSQAILEVLSDGVAILEPDSRIIWANRKFEEWCGGPVVGRIFYEALGIPEVVGSNSSPMSGALAGKPMVTHLQRQDQAIELRLSPIHDDVGKVQHITALCRDVSSERRKQKKLDALHQASRQLACLQADISDDDRIEVLKHNIRELTHNLLHYDVIEIRILDPRTKELKPLLADGMTPEATARVLHAKTEGNGVTGLVAATGETYVCHDAAKDPHYIEGSIGARSSLTIALREGGEILGTFNVESPQVNAFSLREVQFGEIFCRELASALRTLDLLLVERRATATHSIEAINQSVSIPVDEILTAATSLLDRWIGHDDEMAETLKLILARARTIKESILRVGEDITPAGKELVTTGEQPCRLSQRVLVVDNDERMRRSAHSILGRLGCIVETARDGKEAIALAKLSRYDTMLADISLPDISGYEVYRALRQAQPSSHVVLMTGFGYDGKHSIVKAKQDGLRYVLFKPFRVDQLLTALRNVGPPPGKA
ncbi:MAG: response regulator [Gemmataceae bacterium]|nr:response regulator [Gemmataceae bacterium]